MSDYESYAMRQKRAARAGQPVTYVYDPIPKQMRAQAFHAMQQAGGREFIKGDHNPFWELTERNIVREHGYYRSLPDSGPGTHRGAYDRVIKYLATVDDTDRFLDAIELGFREAQRPALPNLGSAYNRNIEEVLKRSVDELNQRFGQHDLGYSFVGIPGTIIRLDSQYVHSEVVEPVIAALHNEGWQGPLEEFMRAHRHYRHGNNKEAMNEALKAFESTMKAIIEDRGWHYAENWQAKNLIQALFDNHLLPSPLESYFGGIRSVLQSGVPTLRNQQSGHGQGSAISEVPAYIAAFTLHLTASNIVFLLSAHAETPKIESKP